MAEDRVSIPLTLDSPSVLSSRLANLESPAEMYTLMWPVPNSRPWAAVGEEWMRSFTAAAERADRLVIDHDPPRSITTRTSGPEAEN
ncbi:hypothetical protein [Streptomyces sp. NPDC007088]|uniref:hypothetical protein n=1 Tax=Streptomyces sp. NPDC007088 TaxID=3364773 RepID=UPI003674871A